MEKYVIIRTTGADIAPMVETLSEHGFVFSQEGKTREGVYSEYVQPEEQDDFSWIQLQAAIERANTEAELSFSEWEEYDEVFLGQQETEMLVIEV